MVVHTPGKRKVSGSIPGGGKTFSDIRELSTWGSGQVPGIEILYPMTWRSLLRTGTHVRNNIKLVYKAVAHKAVAHNL